MISFVYILLANDGVRTEQEKLHRVLGVATMVIACVQVSLGILRNVISQYEKRDPNNPADHGPRYGWCGILQGPGARVKKKRLRHCSPVSFLGVRLEFRYVAVPYFG